MGGPENQAATVPSAEATASELKKPFSKETISKGTILTKQNCCLLFSRILLVYCLERCVAVKFPMFHYTKKRKYFGGAAVTVVFLLSAVNGVLTPVLYYWNLALTGTLELNQPVRKLPYALSVWKATESWWKVRAPIRISVFTYCLFICLFFTVSS